MALHLQQQILDALAALLAAGGTVAGEAVYVDRLDPLPRGKTHAILVREGEGGDDVEPGSIHDVQQRELEVETLCVLKAHADAAAEARAFGLQVEKLIAPNNATLRGLCKQGWRLANSRLVQSGDGEEATAGRLLTWRFSYLVRKATPDVAA